MSRIANARRAAFITPLLGCLALAPAWLVPTPSVAASVQGSGTSASETRTVADFQAIGLSGSMDLVVRQGAVRSVQVQADDNLLPLLETVVENNSLQVRWKKAQSLTTRAKVLVTVVVPKLTGLAVAGSGDVRMETFSTPALQLSLSGSGDARLEALTTDDLGIRISGSGEGEAQHCRQWQCAPERPAGRRCDGHYRRQWRCRRERAENAAGQHRWQWRCHLHRQRTGQELGGGQRQRHTQVDPRLGRAGR
jgi:hypothetical protein